MTDWLPTITALAGITSFSAKDGHELDGFDQSASITVNQNAAELHPRQLMVYNLYVNIDGKDFNISDNGMGAIRNLQYKLLLGYEDEGASTETSWSDIDEELSSDDDLSGGRSCSQSKAMDGTYTRFLFDIANDPYETTNLYGLEGYSDVQVMGHGINNAVDNF